MYTCPIFTLPPSTEKLRAPKLLRGVERAISIPSVSRGFLPKLRGTAEPAEAWSQPEPHTLPTGGWFISAVVWPTDKTCRSGFPPSPHSALLSLLLAACRSLGFLDEVKLLQSCGCVLEPPTDLGFGPPAHNLLRHTPASQHQPLPWRAPESSKGSPSPGPALPGREVQLGKDPWGATCPKWEREGR